MQEALPEMSDNLTHMMGHLYILIHKHTVSYSGYDGHAANSFDSASLPDPFICVNDAQTRHRIGFGPRHLGPPPQQSGELPAADCV